MALVQVLYLFIFTVVGNAVLPTRKKTDMLRGVANGFAFSPGQRGANRPPQVYVYPTEDIEMYTSCRDRTEARLSQDMKSGTVPKGFHHHVDYFFLKHILDHSFVSVPPEEADLFVVPGLCSQSAMGHCSNSHEANVQQLAAYLKSSQWFTRRDGRDHFIMCDKWRAWEELNKLDSLKNLILGVFEHNSTDPQGLDAWPGRSIGVGYTTPYSFSSCLQPPRTDWHHRKYDINSVMSMSTTKTKSHRQSLVCALLHPSNASQNHDANQLLMWIKVQELESKGQEPLNCDGKAISNKQVTSAKVIGFDDFHWKESPNQDVHYDHGKCDGYDSASASRFQLSMMGDTPTTNRFFDAFLQETPVVVLSSERSATLPRLPFPDVVPWSSLVVDIDDGEWDTSPLETLAFNKLDDSMWRDTIHLLRKYRDDVMWHTPGSRAADHLLREAVLVAQQGEHSSDGVG